MFAAAAVLLASSWLLVAGAAETEKESAEDEAPPEKIVKTEAEWKKQLSKEQFRVTRLKGTEPAFTGKFWNSKKAGVYHCICCDQPLFNSDTKFDSGTGWPSFYQPLKKNAVGYHEDNSSGELRMEVVCSRCDAHLGHVFSDGPAPTAMRFCMNSASLKHVPRDKKAVKKSKP